MGMVRAPSGIHTSKGMQMPEDRELIEPNEGDKRFVRRDEKGQFTESQDDVGKSLSQDQQQSAQKNVQPGQGDRGDQK